MYANAAVIPTIQTFTLEFSQGFHAYLTPEKMCGVVERNKNETDPHTCRSQEFCDANMFLY